MLDFYLSYIFILSYYRKSLRVMVKNLLKFLLDKDLFHETIKLDKETSHLLVDISNQLPR